MKIVKWSNGQWSLRKFSFLDMKWVYKDFSYPHWWPKGSKHFADCLAPSEEVVREHHEALRLVKKVAL